MNERQSLEALQQARLDGELDAEGERMLARAESLDPALAASGAELARLVDGLRGLPREIEPPRDLLPAIVARTVERPAPPRRGWMLAAALAAAIGAAFLAGRWSAPGPGSAPQAPVASREPDTVTAALAPATSLAAVTTSLTATRRELRRAFDARRADLPPATLALIEDNLATIERATAEIETALAADPFNRELGRRLVAYQTREIALLEQAHRAASRL